MARLLASLNGVIVSGTVAPGTRKRVTWGELPQGWMAHFGGEEIQLPPGRWEIDVTQTTGTDDFAIVHWPGDTFPVSIATAPPVGTTVGYAATMRSAMMRRIITTGRVIVRVDATANREFVMHARMLPPPLILAGVLALWRALSGGSHEPNNREDAGRAVSGGNDWHDDSWVGRSTGHLRDRGSRAVLYLSANRGAGHLPGDLHQSGRRGIRPAEALGWGDSANRGHWWLGYGNSAGAGGKRGRCSPRYPRSRRTSRPANYSGAPHLTSLGGGRRG